MKGAYPRYFPVDTTLQKLKSVVHVPGVADSKFVGGKKMLVTQLFCSRKQDVKVYKNFSA